MTARGPATLVLRENDIGTILLFAYTHRLASSRLRGILDLSDELKGRYALPRAQIYYLAGTRDIEEIFQMPCVQRRSPGVLSRSQHAVDSTPAA